MDNLSSQYLCQISDYSYVHFLEAGVKKLKTKVFTWYTQFEIFRISFVVVQNTYKAQLSVIFVADVNAQQLCKTRWRMLSWGAHSYCPGTQLVIAFATFDPSNQVGTLS